MKNVLKKFAASLVMAGLLLAPVGCTKAQFVNTTDKVGQALVALDGAYGILESYLEVALNKQLPDASKISGYIAVVKSIRDILAASVYSEDVDVSAKAEAAEAVATAMLRDAEESVK